MSAIPHVLVSTSGVPPILNTRFHVLAMSPSFFQNQVTAGMTRFRHVELHISAYSGADLKVLGEIPFDELKIQTLVITHHLLDASPRAVLGVWACTQAILAKLAKSTGLTSLVVRDPFPPDMLRNRASHARLVASLQRRLTPTDQLLCTLIEDSPTVLTVRRPRLEDGRAMGPEADARIYEFFLALRMRDLIRVE